MAELQTEIAYKNNNIQCAIPRHCVLLHYGNNELIARQENNLKFGSNDNG